MLRSTRPIPILSAVLVAIAVTPGTAAAKCVESIGHPVRPGYVLIVDGQLIGEYAMGAQADMPPKEEIHSVHVTCIDAPQADAAAGARQAAVTLVTKSGSARLLTTYLSDLVREQEEHRARHGSYAPDLETLGFFRSRVPVALEMRVEEAGWQATARVEGLDPVCTVAVGSAVARERGHRRPGGRGVALPRSTPGEPRCASS